MESIDLMKYSQTETRLRYFVLNISRTVMDPQIINITQAMSLPINYFQRKTINLSHFLQGCFENRKSFLHDEFHFTSNYFSPTTRVCLFGLPNVLNLRHQ